MKLNAWINGLGVAALVLTAGITLSAPVSAQPWDRGDRWEYCRDRIHEAERHVRHMVDRFGWRSPQAEDARSELERVRYRCHHRWGDRHDWGERRDWDRPRY